MGTSRLVHYFLTRETGDLKQAGKAQTRAIVAPTISSARDLVAPESWRGISMTYEMRFSFLPNAWIRMSGHNRLGNKTAEAGVADVR